MTYREIEQLAMHGQEMPKSASLAELACYHSLRGVFTQYACSCLRMDAVERERRSILKAYHRALRSDAMQLQCYRRQQECIRKAGTLRADLLKGAATLSTGELLGIACQCIAAMTGDKTFTQLMEKYRNRAARKDKL